MLRSARPPWADPAPPPEIVDYLPSGAAFSILQEALQVGDRKLVELFERADYQKVPGAAKEVLAGYDRVGRSLATSGTTKIYHTGCTDPMARDPFRTAKEWSARAARKGPRPGGVTGSEVFSRLSAEVPPEAPRPVLPAPTKIGLLFPGQGSQYTGMVQKMRDHPRVREYAAAAQRLLGYDLLEVCGPGMESKLEDTSIVQPAMYFANLAAVEKLRAARPEAVENPGGVAGLSLGEYSALCVAGVFTFEEGLKLVMVRGSAMEEAAKMTPQAMLSIAGLDQETVSKHCRAQAVGGEVCQIANVLFHKGFSCAGTRSAVEALKVAVDKDGALQTRLLKTSGAFHTDLMKPAQGRLEAALKAALPRMRPPRCDVYMNSTGARVPRGTDPAAIVPLLVEQIVSPVLWEPEVRRMIQDGLTEFYEVGPMKQLKAIMKRIDAEVFKATVNIEV